MITEPVTVSDTVNNEPIPERMNEAYGILMEAATSRSQIPGHTFDYIENCLDNVTELPTSQNPAYGKVPTRAEDDQDYHGNEGMGGAAEVRTTRNEAYGTSSQQRSYSTNPPCS